MSNIFDKIDPVILTRIQSFRLMDDDFMTVVFDGDNEATEFLLRILLKRDDLSVKKVTTQKEKRNLFGRSVKLDILAEDLSGKLYNVEVQRANEGASPKRVRYNQAMLDSHMLKKNEDFNKLPETYIIFITENDYYGLGQPFYKIKKIVELATTDCIYLPFDDSCNIIYVNGEYRGDDAIGKLMHDFCTPNADEMNYSELAEKVRYHKQQGGGIRTMCRIIEEYGDEREAKAKKETSIANAKALYANGVSVDIIAKSLGMTEEHVKDIVAEVEVLTQA